MFACDFINNTAAKYGGGVNYRYSPQNITFNSTFFNNDAYVGGGVNFFESFENIMFNGEFIGNSAYNGGAIASGTGVIEDVFFKNNYAGAGGALYFEVNATVVGCNFTNNAAINDSSCGGSIFFLEDGYVANCNFINNKAYAGSTIFFFHDDGFTNIGNISHSIFLNNRAYVDEDTPFNVTINENNIKITFMGYNNLLNAIYSRANGEVNFTNVTYWGASGIENTGNSTIVLSGSNNEAGQNISVNVVVDDVIVENDVLVTDENGTIILNISVGDNYFIRVSHDEDSYYTETEKVISQKMIFNVNVTAIETNNRTVNITAKSNIFSGVMPGKLIFILPNGSEIDANYSSNGTWWAVHSFDVCGEYNVSASYVGLDNVVINNSTITINNLKTEFFANAITTIYNVNNVLTVSLKDEYGIPLSAFSVIVNLNGAKTYTTDKNGQIKVSTKGLIPKVYTARMTFNGNANYTSLIKEIKVTVKKATPKITAKKKTFKKSVKVKKYTIVLKDNLGKAINKANVYIKVGKKTFNAKTNAKGKATFKIKKLTKKGKYVAKITYNGNKFINKVAKKIKITIK